MEPFTSLPDIETYSGTSSSTPVPSTETHDRAEVKATEGVTPVTTKERSAKTLEYSLSMLPFDTAVKNYPLELRIDTIHDEEPEEIWHPEWFMYNIFNAYLQPGSKLSADEAARCLDAILPDHRPDTPEDPDNDKEEVANFMLELSDFFWKIAKQTPHNHESQDKLVQLVMALKRLPISVTHERYDGTIEAIWRASPFGGWSESARLAFADEPEKIHFQAGKSAEQVGDEYVNLNAFNARLHASKMTPEYHIAFTAVSQAFVQHEPEFQKYHIVAAAQWMVHAVEWFWDEIRWGYTTSFWNTSSKSFSFSPSDWVEWMRGFQNITTEDKDTQDWAHLAAKKMEDVMVAHGYAAREMEEWDPDKDTIHGKLWNDPQFAHLFKVPEADAKQEAE